jgi:hypothetical protein
MIDNDTNIQFIKTYIDNIYKLLCNAECLNIPSSKNLDILINLKRRYCEMQLKFIKDRFSFLNSASSLELLYRVNTISQVLSLTRNANKIQEIQEAILPLLNETNFINPMFSIIQIIKNFIMKSIKIFKENSDNIIETLLKKENNNLKTSLKEELNDLIKRIEYNSEFITQQSNELIYDCALFFINVYKIYTKKNISFDKKTTSLLDSIKRKKSIKQIKINVYINYIADYIELFFKLSEDKNFIIFLKSLTELLTNICIDNSDGNCYRWIKEYKKSNSKIINKIIDKSTDSILNIFSEHNKNFTRNNQSFGKYFIETFLPIFLKEYFQDVSDEINRNFEHYEELSKLLYSNIIDKNTDYPEFLKFNIKQCLILDKDSPRLPNLVKDIWNIVIFLDSRQEMKLGKIWRLILLLKINNIIYDFLLLFIEIYQMHINKSKINKKSAEKINNLLINIKTKECINMRDFIIHIADYIDLFFKFNQQQTFIPFLKFLIDVFVNSRSKENTYDWVKDYKNNKKKVSECIDNIIDIVLDSFLEHDKVFSKEKQSFGEYIIDTLLPLLLNTLFKDAFKNINKNPMQYKNFLNTLRLRLDFFNDKITCKEFLDKYIKEFLSCKADHDFIPYYIEDIFKIINFLSLKADINLLWIWRLRSLLKISKYKIVRYTSFFVFLMPPQKF